MSLNKSLMIKKLRKMGADVVISFDVNVPKTWKPGDMIIYESPVEPHLSGLVIHVDSLTDVRPSISVLWNTHQIGVYGPSISNRIQFMSIMNLNPVTIARARF